VADGRRIRPILWVVCGAVGVLVGLGVGMSAVSAATRVGDVAGAPRCQTDFAAKCTTERAAVLTDRLSARGSWFTGEQRWLATVPQGAPNLTHGELLKLEVPRQHGSEGLVEGTELTVVYFGRAPAWIRLPSGTVLQTDDHPRRAAPLLGWMTLFAFCGGIFGIQTGTRSARREGAWLRRVPSHVVVGVAGVLAIAGLFGWAGQMTAGGTLWPGIAAGLIGIGTGVLSWRRTHRREAGNFSPN
jgi:hypothetical protein